MIPAPQPQTGHIVAGDIDGSVEVGLELDAYGGEGFFGHELISLLATAISQTAKRFKITK
jgi:hypothetical protein